ncbi:hypothetical protein GCM10009609_15990 [Pseudonocardia aurantiaca]|uniref:DUF3040 domain-containing protein n=1 Tax=Pseudonocardia aurantiaca TaxID=75290 RepID=A0ABW4FKY3_9PSEU
MPLTRSERRELRRLGRAVAAEDPAFARLLKGHPGFPSWMAVMIRRFAWALAAVATLLLAAGAIMGDVSLLAGGLLVLVSGPPILLIMARALALEWKDAGVPVGP